MVKFAYNNAKNASTSHTLFKLNYDYHPYVFFEKNTNLCLKSKLADKLSVELRDLMTICQRNLHPTQKFQKETHNKDIKPRSYASDNKIWLNSKYIKTKQNRKLKAKFFEPFQVLYYVSKQAYKLKLPKKWKIHNVFNVLLLE